MNKQHYLIVVLNLQPPLITAVFLLTKMGENMAGRPFVANNIDIAIGKKLALLRCRGGYSQKDVANAIGVTFQQVQKYEVASNRIAVSTLYKIAKFLEVPFSAFFDETESGHVMDPDINHAILTMLRMDAENRKLVFKLINALGKN